jgi:transposase-like protein
MLELGEEAEGAVLRQGATELAGLMMGDTCEDESSETDAMLSAAVASEALERFARYRRGHEKALYAALNKLEEFRASRQQPSGQIQATPRGNFDTEAACVTYLQQRFERDDWCCPRCSNHSGNWLKGRQRWQCARCGRQVGLRYGTVMHRSPLPLKVWFKAIQALSQNPRATTQDVISVTGIQRRQTVRSVIARIQQATTSKDAPQLLAGLNGYFELHPRLRPEASAHK